MDYLDELEFSSKICNLLRAQGYIAQTEINSGYGIADVVAIKFNEDRISQRLEYDQRCQLTSESFFKVLEAISEDKFQPTSVQEIVSKTNFTKSYVRAHLLRQLLDMKFIRKTQRNEFVKVNGWAPLSDKIVAIESKLSNWRRGLSQAIRYKTFADTVYLALPINKIHLVDNDELVDYNLGLLTIRDEAVEIVHEPKEPNLDIINAKQNYVCEHFWATVTSLNSSAKY